MSGSRVTTTGLLAVVLVLVASLAACDSTIFWGPVSIKRDNVQLLVAVCADIDVRDGFASVRNRGEDEGWKRFWEASGEASVKSGDILSLSDGVEGLVATTNSEPRLSPGTEFFFGLRGQETDEVSEVSAEFEIGEGGLSGDVWLHPDGTTTLEPCPTLKRSSGRGLV